MKSRLQFILKYFLFWFCYFVVVKTLFIFFNVALLKNLTVSDFFGIYYHGLKLDISASTYLLLLPFILAIPTAFLRPNYLVYTLRIYTLILLVVITIFVSGDLELYQYWGFRLDTTPLLYIQTPGEMVASVEWFVIVRQFIIMSVLIFFSYKLYKKLIESKIYEIKKGHWAEIIIIPVAFISLLLPIRGGWNTAPLNTGTAYFSKNEFANHAAINIFWNVGFSLTVRESLKNPYIEMDVAKASKIITKLHTNEKSTCSVIKNTQPNIILIIIESYTAKAISVVGGAEGITPCFNKLSKEGVLFSNIFASGSRSDKGIVAILSGFPAQPIASIINFPNKTQSLPFISKDLAKCGYQSAFYYGGDINFASMRSYLENGGFDKIIDESGFAKETPRTNWGVPDHLVFQKLLNDLHSEKKPFFNVLFTLSSHPPYDVMMETVIPGNDIDHKFMNSLFYADKCLGAFIDSAKKQDWWSNTLIVVTADHGSMSPFSSTNYDADNYHVPLLFLGGALAKSDTIINQIGSQTDIALTLLDQLKITPQKAYKYSKNLLSSKSNKFAFSNYKNGICFFTDSLQIAYDYDQKAIKKSTGIHSDSTLQIAKGYMQEVYNDFMFIGHN
jgi:phosphoglycerol transferase MdoB-like AlkP superfamily enzyme